jgi:integration host factor subunit beta
MTRSELIDAFARRADINRQKAQVVVETFFTALAKCLAEGQRVELRHFGNFSVRTYGSYVGRNPKSGDKVFVGNKRLPHFKPSLELRQRLNPARKEG